MPGVLGCLLLPWVVLWFRSVRGSHLPRLTCWRRRYARRSAIITFPQRIAIQFCGLVLGRFSLPFMAPNRPNQNATPRPGNRRNASQRIQDGGNDGDCCDQHRGFRARFARTPRHLDRLVGWRCCPGRQHAARRGGHHHLWRPGASPICTAAWLMGKRHRLASQLREVVPQVGREDGRGSPCSARRRAAGS